MFRTSVVFLTSAALLACGPDAEALVETHDVDSDEALSTAESELTSSSNSSVWFPLNENNSWTFESGSSSRTLSLSSVGNGMAYLSGTSPGAWVGVSSSSANTLARWDASSRTWVSWLRFGFASTTWTIGSGECVGLKLKRSSTGSAVMTPAGAFSDTRTISITQVPSRTALCAPPEFTELTFAAGVGLVAFRTGYGQRFVLKSATVGSKRWPAAQGVTATLTLDKSAYVNKPNTIRCITTPCPGNDVTAVMKATFRVTNNGTSSMTWNFRTGCQADVELVGSNGLTVKRLSDERVCTQALSSVTLAAGQSRSWQLDVPLMDRDGLQLDGSFTARARLIPASATPAAPAATAAFTVRIQE